MGESEGMKPPGLWENEHGKSSPVGSQGCPCCLIQLAHGWVSPEWDLSVILEGLADTAYNEERPLSHQVSIYPSGPTSHPS